MKKIGIICKRGICAAAIVFTVGTLILNLLLLASGKTEFSMSAERSLWLFLYAVLCGVASVLRRQTELPSGMRYTFHFLLTVGGFFLTVLLPSGVSMQSSVVFVLVVFFCVLYALVLGICLAIRQKTNRKKDRENTPYVSQYQKK